MARYRCVVCKESGATNVRHLDDRSMRVCDEHRDMDGAEIVQRARPAAQGSKEMFRLRAQLAARTRVDPVGDHMELRRELAFATVYSTIEKALVAGPQLTPEQREQLARMLK